MDYEKKYNEALKWMRELYPGLHGATKEDAEHFFPELRESDDERIIRAIIDALYSHTNSINLLSSRGYQMGNIEAWLEKHKYDRMKPVYDNQDSFESALGKAWKDYNDSGAITVDGCEDNYVECAHAKGFRDGYLFGLEKQKEYHIPWYDYQKSKEAGYTIVPNEEYEQLIKQKEQKPAWGEDDNKMLAGTLNSLKRYQLSMPNYQVELQMRWLKSIRPQPKQEWGEEDERIVGRIQMILEFFDRNYPADMNIGSEVPKYISWLKSLRPSWKPSEEQMDALKELIDDANRAGWVTPGATELYEQLKKL